MSKAIRMTPQIEAEVRTAFELAMSNVKFADGKVSFTKTFAATNQKAWVFFTEIAWRKMEALIKNFDKEVAWHGTASRLNIENKHGYLISDIFVYPQQVTGASVETDQEKYQNWLFDLEDDVFNNLRMQGHSHVNMSTSPSSTDLTHQNAILSRMTDDMFYIFMIWNKRGEKNIKIYDLDKNTLFEPGDITVSVLGDIDMTDFIADAKKVVENYVYKSNEAKSKNSYGKNSYNGYPYYDDDDDDYYGNYGYNGYGYSHKSGYGSSNTQSTSTPSAKPSENPPKDAPKSNTSEQSKAVVLPTAKVDATKGTKKHGTKKGKRKRFK